MSEHESGSSDDEDRIKDTVATKKLRRNVTYQRAARPTTYNDNDDDFDRQLRLEQTKKLQDKVEKSKRNIDPDGTLYEWDPAGKR